METKQELKILLWIGIIFGVAFFMPVESIRFKQPLMPLSIW